MNLIQLLASSSNIHTKGDEYQELDPAHSCVDSLLNKSILGLSPDTMASDNERPFSQLRGCPSCSS